MMILAGNPTSKYLFFSVQIPNGPLNSQLCLSSISNSSSTPYSFPNISSPQQFQSLSLKGCRHLFVNAIKKRRSGGGTGTSLVELSDSDNEFDDVDEGDLEDDDEEMLMSFGKMKKWIENKPRGFGEGKVYDTSIEDKLLEELQQSRQAQAANINNLKNNPLPPPPKKQLPNKKGIDEVTPGAIRVRVVNLPKKKNIHRDLKAAFKGFPGIVNIIPAVSGNKKTKDPICKGFAFVDFKSEDAATRFIKQFSRQTVAFGKIQKQIRCEIQNSSTSNSSDDEAMGSLDNGPELMDSGMEGELDDDFDAYDSSFDTDDEFIEAEFEDLTENVESLSISEMQNANKMESLSSKKPDKNSKKKVVAKGSKKAKLPKLDIPGSAKRLKIKEKAVLRNVFTKYGLETSLGSREGK